jgi:hypothetical protein
MSGSDQTTNPGEPVVQQQQAGAEEEDNEGDYEVPDEIEEVIEELLTGLRSSETIIRWSAAKGERYSYSYYLHTVNHKKRLESKI